MSEIITANVPLNVVISSILPYLDAESLERLQQRMQQVRDGQSAVRPKNPIQEAASEIVRRMRMDKTIESEDVYIIFKELGVDVDPYKPGDRQKVNRALRKEGLRAKNLAGTWVWVRDIPLTI